MKTVTFFEKMKQTAFLFKKYCLWVRKGFKKLYYSNIFQNILGKTSSMKKITEKKIKKKERFRNYSSNLSKISKNGYIIIPKKYTKEIIEYDMLNKKISFCFEQQFRHLRNEDILIKNGFLYLKK